MSYVRVITVLGLILAVSGMASGVDVPLPSNGRMVVAAHNAFAEIFLQVKNAQNPLLLPVGLYNNVAIGFTRDANGDGVEAPNDLAFVLYTGALSSTAANPTPPGTVLLVDPTGNAIKAMFTGTGAWNGLSEGRLMVAGIVQTIRTSDMVSYNIGGSDPNTNPQLTFTLYNAHVKDMNLSAIEIFGTGGYLLTDFFLDDNNPPHLDVYSDAQGDAWVQMPPGGQRYLSRPDTPPLQNYVTPEIPLRDTNSALMANIDQGTYYTANAAWGKMDWAGNPTDDDEVMWSFVGNPEAGRLAVQESFNLLGTGESFNMLGPDGKFRKVYTSGPSDIDTNVSLEGQLKPGPSLNPTPGKTFPHPITGLPGYGRLNSLLCDVPGDDDYWVSGSFSFGGKKTGAYDSDPNTWTFQQEPAGTVTLTQLSGILAPEPVTLLSLVLAAGGLAGYIRKRRRA